VLLISAISINSSYIRKIIFFKLRNIMHVILWGNINKYIYSYICENEIKKIILIKLIIYYISHIIFMKSITFFSWGQSVCTIELNIYLNLRVKVMSCTCLNPRKPLRYSLSKVKPSAGHWRHKSLILKINKLIFIYYVINI